MGRSEVAGPCQGKKELEPTSSSPMTMALTPTPTSLQPPVHGPPLLSRLSQYPYQPNLLSYLVVSLERPHTCTAWGMQLSKLDPIILVGGVQHPAACRQTYGHSFPACPDLSIVYKDPGISIDAYVAALKQLGEGRVAQTQTSPPPLPAERMCKILPGDVLAAINGIPIEAFGSLAECSDYLRNQRTLTLVVVRNLQAITAASLVRGRGGSSHQAASAAYQIWTSIIFNSGFPLTPPEKKSPSLNDNALARQVTPDLETARYHHHTGDFALAKLHRQWNVPPPYNSFTIHRPAPNYNPIPPSIPPTTWRNPWFQDGDAAKDKRDMELQGIPFCDNFDFLPEDGTRARLFLPPISNFQDWLGQRKTKWRNDYYQVHSYASPTVKRRVAPTVRQEDAIEWRNPWFVQTKDRVAQDASTAGEASDSVEVSISTAETMEDTKLSEENKNIPFVDNLEEQPEDGKRAALFLPTIPDTSSTEFQSWIQARKTRWRTSYKVYRHAQEETNSNAYIDEDRTVAVDFWATRFDTFEDWLAHSLHKWKLGYSWNRRKRTRLVQECQEVVHLSSGVTEKEGFDHWLKIRKRQWMVHRRKRQRLRKQETAAIPQSTRSQATSVSLESGSNNSSISLQSAVKHQKDVDLVLIDDLLQQEERKRRAMEERQKQWTVDRIAFVFDQDLGVPDDVVVHIMEFLPTREHTKLLGIDRTTRAKFQQRDAVWQKLCPSRWRLPRRPRKSWYELYITSLRKEAIDLSRKWDGIVLQCSSILSNRDHLQKIEKLVAKGEQDCGFDINYVSPVVCERNSILNLAVIHQRHKTVRWLVEVKNADIESFDRGSFTPLLNAAWAGDRTMVRFFLQRGSNRKQIGTGHYSQKLADPNFQGLTAEGWARRRGHDHIADLLRVGL